MMRDAKVVRSWQADRRPAVYAEMDRWVAHEMAEAEAEAACLLTRNPRAWSVASVRFAVEADAIHVFTGSGPSTLPPGPAPGSYPPRKIKRRRGEPGQAMTRPRGLAPAPDGAGDWLISAPLTGGRAYYAAVVAELMTRPGQWATVATGQTNNGIAATLKTRGCETTCRGSHGDLTIYARWTA